MRDIDRLYNNGKKKDGVYDKFVKNNPNVASRMFSPAKMSTDEARRNEATYVDYGNELSQMRARALDRFMAENPLPERVSPATPLAIRNNRFYQENSTRPSTFVGNTEKASPYTIGVQDRLSMAVTGKPTAERQAAIDRALAPYLQNREAERVAYYKDKDISEKPVSMLTDEEKQALKAEYEGYDNKNFFERRADLKYNDEYERKQALYPNYRELKNEDAYKALIAHGMTDEEIRLLNESPIDEDEAASLSAKGMTEEQMEELSNQRNAAKQAAMTKFENLVNSVDESWGVTAEDITNMVEDRYANPEIVKEAERRPVSNSLFTLATNPVESALEVGADAYNYMTGRPIQNRQTATELIRNTTTENIDNQLGRTLYGGAMSIGDMAVAAGLGYATGGGSIVSAGVQALEKASQVMGEGVDRRLNPDQIFAEGIASGVTTYVTEKIPMGMLEEVAQKGLTNYTAKEIGKYLGSMFLSEGLQEASEDVADWVADAVIAWDKNEFNTQVQELVSQGMSNKEAALKVIADRGVEMLTDFVIGGIGGAQMGSVSTGLANYLGKYNSNPSVYTNKIMGSKVALNTLLEAGKTLSTDSLTGEDAARVEHAKEVANKPIEDVTEEDIVDLSNVLNEQANEANNYAQTIREINYQASVDQNLKEYRENKTITPAEGETEIERLARKNAESIAVREDKMQQAAQRQREKELLDYQVNGLKSKLGKALNNFAEEFENEYAAKTFLENFKDQNAALYSSASLQAYRAGETGQSFATFLENSTEAKIMLESGLSEAYLKTLYYQGQNTRTEEDSLNFRVVQNPNRGLATGGEDELTPLKQKIAKVLGVEVATDFEKATTRGDFSVAIAKIMVNATADNQYTALMHEVFEFARAYNPEGMKLAQKTLVDMLVKKTGERAFFDAVIDYREAYRKAGKDAKNNKKLNADEKAALMKEANKTTDEAQEEFINDAIAYVFTTDEGIKALTDFLMSDENTTQKEKVSAIQAIKDFVDHLIKTIKNFISKKDNKQLGYKYAEYANFSTEELEKVSRLLTGVLDEARKNLARMTEEQSGGAEAENTKVAHSIKVVDIDKIKAEAAENIKTVAAMKSVTSVDDNVNYSSAKEFKKEIARFFSKYNYSVYNDSVGDIELTERGIEKDLGHKGGPIKRATFYAIPTVIKNGKVIDYTPNYTGNNDGKDRLIIAAPVTVKNNGEYLVGVVIERVTTDNYQKYYMHSVAAVNKNGLPLSEAPTEGRNLTGKPLSVTEILRRAIALTNNIAKNEEKSNTQDIVEGATEQQIEDSDIYTAHSLRVDAPPKKTLKAYKVFVAFENDPGHLYPPMVASPGGSPTALGVWLDADTGEVARDKDGNIIVNKNGRMQVKQGGKGTNKSGGGTLAWRPGWHLGEYPDAKQFAVKDPETGELKSAFPANFIFAECEIAADNDYQLDAMAYGVSEKGKFNRSQAGLPYIPKDGYYKYRTNPDPNTSPWYITGSMKVSRILDDAEVRRVCAEYGVTPLKRVGGDIDLAKYGFKAGNVEASNTDNLPPHVDYSEEIKKLPGYVKRDINFDDPSVVKEFKINNLNINDYRHSLAVPVKDSDGRNLSKQQQEYFKDSKIRDAEGNLLKVYHGSMADFTVFDIGEARDSEDIEAFFFSPVSEEAEGYGNTRAFYLNITNPADFDTAYDIFFKQRKENPAGAGARAREELISLGYDGVAAIDPSDPEYPEYLAFYPEQIKLVSNTKPTKNEDIRFSIDVKYDEAYKNNDISEMDSLVEQAARAAGYDSPMLYHGTMDFGFTQIDLDKMDDKMSFFATDNLSIASSYSGVEKTRGITEGAEIPTENIVDELKKSGRWKDIREFSKGDEKSRYEYLKEQSKRMANFVNQHEKDMYDKGLMDDYRKFANELATQIMFKNIDLKKLNILMKPLRDAEYVITDYVHAIKEALLLLRREGLTENVYTLDGIARVESEIREMYLPADYQGVYKLYGNLDNFFEVDARNMNWNALINWTDNYTKLFNENNTSVKIEKGRAYLMSGDKELFDVAATEVFLSQSEEERHEDLLSRFHHSYYSRAMVNYGNTTRSVAKFAKEHDYDGVIIRNIRDDGGRNIAFNHYDEAGNIYIFFNPQAQVKSADTVTYDNEGNVIPLSERFNKDNPDIRFSLSVPVFDSEGRVLSEGQKEFFKDSKIVDENGNLKVMYHGTNRAGFTVFERADDGISYFFTDKKSVASTYSGVDYLRNPDTPMTLDALNEEMWNINGTSDEDHFFKAKNGKIEYWDGDAGKLVKKQTFDTLRDAQNWFVDEYVSPEMGAASNYEVYLKAENPFVYEAKGREWNDLEPAEYKTHYSDLEIVPVGEKFEVDYQQNGVYFHKIYTEKELDRIFGDGTGKLARMRYDSDGQYYEANVYLDKNNKRIFSNTRELAQYAKGNGYDSLIINDVVDSGGYGLDSNETSQVVVVFDSNQIKSIYNDNPTEKEDIRFSLPVTDSTGRKLSEGQRRFFRNSKVLDVNGNLKAMYHGTERGGFTVFDPKFSDDGISLFFTDDKDIAKAYSGTDKEIKLYRTVKDLEELIHDSYTHIVKDGNTYRIINGFDDDAETEFEGTFDELKEYVEEQYGVEEATNYKVYLNAENPLIIDAEGNNWDEIPEAVKGLTTTREYAVYAKENGYDSVIINNVVDSGVNADSSSRYKNTQVVIVFDSNQVKSVDNLNPTDNPDIRHSIDVIDPFFDAFREIDEEVKLDESDLEKFIKEKMDLDSDVTQKAVQEVAKNIKKAYGSNIRTDRLAGDIMSVFRYLKSTGNMSMKDLMFVMQDIARPVLEDVKASDPEQEKMYKDFVNTVKKYKISLDAGQMAEVANSFGSYYEFQRAMRGKINLSKDGGTPLDNIWTEICDVSNGHLSYGTNPNDQPLALAEYIHSLAPTYQTQEGESLDDAATDLALEIFRQFYVYQSMTDAAAKVKGELNRRSNEYKNKYKKAYNDAIKQVEAERNLNIQRLANELDDLTAEEQEAIRNGDAINQAVIKNLKEDYQRRLDRLRAQSNERIAREKAKYQNAWITKNLRRERSELKNRVLREVKALQNMIAHPAEGASKHVPINLIKPTIEMLEAINLDNGGRNKAIAERLKKMAEVYETFKSEEYSFDYDERIAGDIKELQEMFEGKSYADLQITELERVIEIVVALKTQIRNANNLILNGKLKDAQEAASSAMTSVRQSRRYDNAAMNALNKYANIHLNAYREFRKLSGYDEGSLMEIYRDLDEGSKKEMQIQKDLGEIFQSVLEGKENQKEVKKFISTKKEDLVDIGMKDRNGKPLLITRAMRMSLIMHSMNAGNMRHVLGSGITIPNMYYFEKGKMDEAYAKGINYRFVDYAELLDAIQKNNTAKIEELTKKAQERVEALKNDLSPWEQRFLAAAEEMFHEKTGKYINETSMALKGYAIARVKNYFPIKTDSHFTSQDWSGLVQNASLEGAGVLKERVISTKPILLEDITNVIERQIRFTSKYAGLAVAIRNFDTIMKQISRGGDGQLHNLYETIDSVWGASDTKWLRNLMQDLQGGRSEARSWLMNLRGQFAGATLTLNPSVAIKQAASYPTAAAVVGYKALGRALADMRKGFITKEGLPELEKINPLLWYRNLGNGTQELADAKAVGFGKNLPQWAQKAVNWTQWFDTGTVRTLEYAAKYYVDENYKGLKEGTEAYWEKVSEVFSKVVEETQPNYSTLHKADIIRNPNSFVKMLVMFKTQPMQNFGIVYDALGELNAAKHSGNKKWIDEASSNAARAISSQVVSATVFSAMSILSQLLLHRWWKYRDDDEKWSWEKFWVALGEGALSCMTGAFIGGSELYEALKHIFTGNTYYGIEVSVAEMVNDFVDNVGNLTKNAKALWESNTSEEKEKAAQKILKSSLNLGATVGEFEGTPVNNIKNMLSAMYFYATDIVRSIDEGELSFSNDSNIADWEIETQYERIYQALNNNDTEKYEKLVNELKAKVTDENPDLTEDEVAEKVAESVTKKIVSMVKAEYLEGTKSEEEVTEYLEDAKGMDEDDAYFQIKKWEGNSNSEYKVMNDAIEVAADDPTPENRKAVIEEINGLVEHGKEKKNIADSIQRAYKDKYIELYEQGNATNLNAILRTALVTAGFSDEEAKEKISGWLK
jgi:hypothetical protein